jgi:photosystem II stability/assembly factor-like uncharacterized protein
MRFWLVLCGLLAVAQSPPAAHWVPQESGVKVPLRGVSAVNAALAWASGAKGTFLKTTDGGANWTPAVMPGAADLDFRDVEAVDERTVYLLSSGEGQQSRIYRTTDGGVRWTLSVTNLAPKGFWDAIGFWDATHGILLGDPVDGRFTIQTTSDGGASWQRRQGPKAEKGEGAFAASGTCLFTRGTREVWFGTGGPGGARVFHSTDGGETWSVSKTPIRKDSRSAGIFSIAFADGRRGVAVGGDYMKPEEAAGNVAITEDGGRTWTAPAGAPRGYRSAVAWIDDRQGWIAVGTSGSDVSLDGGKTWTPLDTAAHNAIGFGGGTGWAVGPDGAIARLDWSPRP